MSFQKCNTCGLCKAICPVYNITKNETKSPRSKLVLIKENLLSEQFHECLMCDSCKHECPSEIDIPKEVKKVRTVLVNTFQESDEGKVIMKNLRDKGNIYGI
ncbi:(Fe-S)-binding protein [Candidatus Woesearchaeota archaeon]|nr:(Fe-S)-binding protein [Candidatus Woesearchaeota archaeon]